MQLPGQIEMDIREVDEHGHFGPAFANGTAQLAELAIDAGQVDNDLGHAHYGHVFCPDHGVEAGVDHARPAHAEQLRCDSFEGKLLSDRVDQEGAVEFATGFAGRDEDLRRHESIAVFCTHDSGWRAVDRRGYRSEARCTSI